MTDRDIAAQNRELANHLSNNLGRLLKEFARDYENRVQDLLNQRGHPDIRPPHSTIFANLGTGAVRVTELAERAQVTQQAMGKMLKELERLGYLERAVDGSDRRAREIRLTERGISLVRDSLQAIQEVQAYYRHKAGAENLEALETQLRGVISSLQFQNLPDTWTEGR